MAFRAVSAPMLRSEPGTLLETVAGTMTMGTQNSSYFPRAVNSSSSDRKACRAEPRCFSVCEGGTVAGCFGWLVERLLLATRKGKTKSGGCQGEEPGLSQRTAAKQTGTTPHTLSRSSLSLSHTHSHSLHLQEYKAGERLNRSA